MYAGYCKDVTGTINRCIEPINRHCHRRFTSAPWERKPSVSSPAYQIGARASISEDANPNAQGFNDLEGLAQIGDKLLVSDQVNNRFMIFDQAPKK